MGRSHAGGGGATGGSWCLIEGAQCTDDSACCSGACEDGMCVGETPR